MYKIGEKWNQCMVNSKMIQKSVYHIPVKWHLTIPELALRTMSRVKSDNSVLPETNKNWLHEISCFSCKAKHETWRIFFVWRSMGSQWRPSYGQLRDNRSCEMVSFFKPFITARALWNDVLASYDFQGQIKRTALFRLTSILSTRILQKLVKLWLWPHYKRQA